MAQNPIKQPSRDTLTTINADGSRYAIHTADVRGRFQRWRRLTGWLLIGLFVALPWIQINGHPAVFFNFPQQRFHLFGVTLAFQDTWLLFFVVTGLAFGIFFVTALFGRVWCGWACPQTVYLDQVFRRLERWIEGDAPARRRLDAAPWTAQKVFKRGIKHTLFLLCSAVIAHIFLSYAVSLPRLWEMMHTSPIEHWTAFIFVFGVTAVFYANFTWFREQLCIVICPYGRFQGALIDDHSLNVAYDAQRGDPPGKPRDPTAGDCIDCHRCVQVCPTGIDIRQGLQLECIGCTACIDACDSIMDKLGKPRGLIRYASQEELEGRKTRFVRTRTVIYSVLLVVGTIVASLSLRSIQPAEVATVRMLGMPFFVTDTHVRNQFSVRIINKSMETMHFQVTATTESPLPLEVRGVDGLLTVEPLKEILATLVVQVPREAFQGNFPFTLHAVNASPEVVHTRRLEFLGPDPRLLHAR